MPPDASKSADSPRPDTQPSSLTIWASLNQGEILPALLTPLAGSMLEREYRSGYLFGPLLRRWGIVTVPDGALVDIFHHRPYFNLTRTAALLHRLEVFPFPYLDGQALAIQVAGGEALSLGSIRAALDLSRVSLGKKVHHLFSTVRLLLRMARWLAVGDREGGQACAEFDLALSALLPPDLRSLSLAELRALLESLQKDLPNIAGRANVPGVIVIGLAFFLLDWVIRKWSGERTGIVQADIADVGTTHKMSELKFALWKLVEEAERSEVVRGVFLESPEQPITRILEQLETTVEGRSFLSSLQRFLMEYGHCGPGEIEVSTPRWREVPRGLANTVRRELLAHAAGDSASRRQLERHREVATKRQAITERLGPARRAFFRALLRYLDRYTVLREDSKFFGLKAVDAIRGVALEAGRRLSNSGILEKPEDVFFLTLDELEQLLPGQPTLAGCRTSVATRRLAYEHDATISPPQFIRSDSDLRSDRPSEAPADSRQVLRGVAGSPGQAFGAAYIGVHPNEECDMKAGKVLVVRHPDPNWFPQLVRASALVTDTGGALCHLASIAREFGIPAVFGVQVATQMIQEGEMLVVDGDQGCVLRQVQVD